MSEEGHVIRGINWRQTFPFTNIFRAFRVAFHPSKMVLGLALLLTIYIGGHILDMIWPVHARAIPGEVEYAERISRTSDDLTLNDWREQSQKEVDRDLATELLYARKDKIKDSITHLQDQIKKDHAPDDRDMRTEAAAQVKAAVDAPLSPETYEQLKMSAAALVETIDPEARYRAQEKVADEERDAAVRQATETYNANPKADGADKRRDEQTKQAQTDRKNRADANLKARDEAQTRLKTNQDQGAEVSSATALKAQVDAIDDDAHSRSGTGEVKDKLRADLKTEADKINKAYDDEQPRVNAETDSKKREDRRTALDKHHDQALQAVYDEFALRQRKVDDALGHGLFSTFFEYEITQVSGVVDSVTKNDWLSDHGVQRRLVNFVAVGPLWLIYYHTIFFILFGIIFLFAWSLFGGAISRIAAVHVARDEKISVRQAMNFAVAKFLSFASAPLVPVIIILVIGIVVSLGALLTNIPFLGPIVVGALFFLALIAGFVMTLVLLGTVGGFNLMYPTIAVEGSDSFDAISRSFSYVYARPWRMLFYSIVAIVYGALTYVFVHLFIWLMLVVTHVFVNFGVMTHAADRRGLLSAMWPSPSQTGRLTYHVNYLPLGAGESAGAWLIWFWVTLLVSLLGAFAISLYFSVNTIIYYLMRSEVDATEMDDVYLEQSEDDFTDTPAPGASQQPAPTMTAAATPPAAAVDPAPPADGSAPLSPPQA